MRVDGAEAPPRLELEEAELRLRGSDGDRPYSVLEPFTVVWLGDLRIARAARLVDIDAVPLRVLAPSPAADVLDEAGVRCMEVQVARSLMRFGAREAVDNPGRNRHRRSGTRPKRLRPAQDLELALEDVERVNVVLVVVRAGADEVRSDRHLVDRKLWPLELHADVCPEALATARLDDDRRVHCSERSCLTLGGCEANICSLSPWHTPSFTRIPPIRSSTAPRCPRSWRFARPSSASRRWRSPTTTASTARSSLRTPRRHSASGRSPGRR